MGLPTDKPILSDDHPVVVAFKEENPGCPFIFAPATTKSKSSLVGGKNPVFGQFRNMFGGSFFVLRARERPCLSLFAYLMSLVVTARFWMECRLLYQSVSDEIFRIAQSGAATVLCCP
jgi:hypothetical protein